MREIKSEKESRTNGSYPIGDFLDLANLSSSEKFEAAESALTCRVREGKCSLHSVSCLLGVV
jgi:hypothetical protein